MRDQTRPSMFCQLCGMIEYCDRHLRAEFPPDATERALKRRHAQTQCAGDFVYRAGILPRGKPGPA